MPDTLPLKPIDADTAEKIRAAVGERAAIAEAVATLVDAGLRNVYFVGAGGSIICSWPAHYLLQRGSRSRPSSCRATSSTAAPLP